MPQRWSQACKSTTSSEGNIWLLERVVVDKAHNYRVGFPAKTNHSICSLSFFNAPFYTRLEMFVSFVMRCIAAIYKTSCVDITYLIRKFNFYVHLGTLKIIFGEKCKDFGHFRTRECLRSLLLLLSGLICNNELCQFKTIQC